MTIWNRGGEWFCLIGEDWVGRGETLAEAVAKAWQVAGLV